MKDNSLKIIQNVAVPQNVKTCAFLRTYGKKVKFGTCLAITSSAKTVKVHEALFEGC